MIELQQCPDHEEEWLLSFRRKILTVVHTHCYGHVLNLACGETTKKSKVMRDALDTAYEIVKLVKSLHILMQHYT